MEAKLPQIVYRELGTPPPLAEKPAEKCLIMWWKDLERWSFNYLSRCQSGFTRLRKSKFPIEPLGNHLVETMNGYCIKPVAGPTPHKMLKLNALNPAGLDLTASKFIIIPDKIAKQFSIERTISSFAVALEATTTSPSVLWPPKTRQTLSFPTR